MTTTANASLTGTYAIDASHSQIGFSARYAMVTKVRGQFNEFSGTGFFDLENPANSHLQVTIEAKSIDTGNADRDAHLRGNDFFDMDQFPEIKFVSTSFEKIDADKYGVTGDLTVRGVTKPITIDLDFTGEAVDPWGNLRIGLEGKTTFNRKDWGVNWNAALEAGGVLVSEKINLEFEISAVRSKEVA
jgi:polyisoprenoid-binding protein YceI